MAHIKKVLGFFSILAAFTIYFFLPDSCPETAKRTAAVFAFAGFFWALEVIPLYATSILVVLALTFLIETSSSVLFLQPFSNPVIMLFLGGFILAAAIRKHEVDQFVVRKLLPFFGAKPYFILLGLILTTGFIALWMSNTAATALMLAVIYPLLSKIEARDPFKKALVLSIPFAANIGGIGTPVGTPPNAIAIGILAEYGIRVNFLSWMLMAIPLAIMLLLATSLILYLMFPPKNKRIRLSLPEIKSLKPSSRGVLLISVLTILLWLSSPLHQIPESIIALISVALFSIFRLIDREDLNQINWDILVLMWGGLALGKATELSGLGGWIVSMPFFAVEGFWLVAKFSLLTVIISVFLSNTPTANLMVPLVMGLPNDENKLLLAVVIALSCSFDMILPVSTPPNALAFSTKEISVMDMIRAGTMIVILAVALLLGGYPIFIGGFLRA